MPVSEQREALRRAGMLQPAMPSWGRRPCPPLPACLFPATISRRLPPEFSPRRLNRPASRKGNYISRRRRLTHQSPAKGGASMRGLGPLSDLAATEEPPPPWKRLAYWPVGGLICVGYAADSDLLLVITHSGRGVFDCARNEKVARDYDALYEHIDPVHLTAKGIGPLTGESIRIAGIYGGGLTRRTHDHWRLEELLTDGPT